MQLIPDAAAWQRKNEKPTWLAAYDMRRSWSTVKAARHSADALKARLRAVLGQLRKRLKLCSIWQLWYVNRKLHNMRQLYVSLKIINKWQLRRWLKLRNMWQPHSSLQQRKMWQLRIALKLRNMWQLRSLLKLLNMWQPRSRLKKRKMWQSAVDRSCHICCSCGEDSKLSIWQMTILALARKNTPYPSVFGLRRWLELRNVEWRA